MHRRMIRVPSPVVAGLTYAVLAPIETWRVVRVDVTGPTASYAIVARGLDEREATRQRDALNADRPPFVLFHTQDDELPESLCCEAGMED